MRYLSLDEVLILHSNLIEGKFPSNKLKLVFAWIELHRDELMANWELAINGQTIFSIDPLK